MARFPYHCNPRYKNKSPTNRPRTTPHKRQWHDRVTKKRISHSPDGYHAVRSPDRHVASSPPHRHMASPPPDEQVDWSGLSMQEEKTRPTILSILRTFEGRMTFWENHLEERATTLERTLQTKHQEFEHKSWDTHRQLEQKVSALDNKIKDIISIQDQRAQEAVESDKEINEKLKNLGDLLKDMEKMITEVVTHKADDTTRLNDFDALLSDPDVTNIFD